MKIKAQFIIDPFTVPSYVTLPEKTGVPWERLSNPRSLSLSELEVDTLHRLCDEFRNNVFSMAGKNIED